MWMCEPAWNADALVRNEGRFGPKNQRKFSFKRSRRRNRRLRTGASAFRLAVISYRTVRRHNVVSKGHSNGRGDAVCEVNMMIKLPFFCFGILFALVLTFGVVPMFRTIYGQAVADGPSQVKAPVAVPAKIPAIQWPR